jgi:hypothetical protein
MIRHPYFDLLLHDDLELGALLGSPVCERLTLQEWPLSCVQRVVTEDGRKQIYKAQHDPTVEPEFYIQARSSLLVPAQTIYRSGAYSAMLIDWIDAPTLEQQRLPEAKVVKLGRVLLEQIGQIEGQLPYYLDLSTELKWRERMDGVLKGLWELVGTGRFQIVKPETLAYLERRAFHAEVLSTFRTGIGLVHNDLAGDNVFLLRDGAQVIDWQFPILGPTRLDLALLLDSLGFDASRHVGPGMVWLLRLLRVGWFTDCALRWIPGGGEIYDQQIATLAAEKFGES